MLLRHVDLTLSHDQPSFLPCAENLRKKRTFISEWQVPNMLLRHVRGVDVTLSPDNMDGTIDTICSSSVRVHSVQPCYLRGVGHMRTLGGVGNMSRVRLDDRCRANMAHIRQSRPDSGLGLQVQRFLTF